MPNREKSQFVTPIFLHILGAMFREKYMQLFFLGMDWRVAE